MKTFKNISVLIAVMLNFLGFSQKDSIPEIKGDEVIIQATRLPDKSINLPLSVSLLKFKDRQSNYQQLSLNEYLLNVPGLFVQNSNNFAQDMRISIRGFGARSAFGIRGIKLIVDGIPETTPDGQGQIDNLNLEIIDRIEIIRGPASSLYGNASGGVINIQTLHNVDRNFIQAATTFGAYNMQKYQLLTGLKLKDTDVILFGSHTSSNGYRDRSGFKNNNLNVRIFHHFSGRSKLNATFNFVNSPRAEDAGGLKLEEVAENRKQTRGRNVLFQTGESIRQYKMALNYSLKLKNNQCFNTYAFYTNRNFYGKLPFEFGGIIDLKRDYSGHGSSYQYRHKTKNGINKLMLGYDLAFQKDNRNRFKNLEGKRGDLVFDQVEHFNNIAAYVIDHYKVGNWFFTGGLRYDLNTITADDRFLGNGNQSGRIVLNSFNPSVGILYSLRPGMVVYTGFSTSFETPSLSELSANPTGEEGLNPDLRPQQAKNYELGWKSSFSNKFHLEIAVFHIDLNNEIVPYELEAYPGRSFYQNAGSSTRNGVEASFSYRFLPNLNLISGYTFSDFRFNRFVVNDTNYSNDYLPGIPKNMASLTLQYTRPKGLNFNINSIYNGPLYANNSNSVTVEGYMFINTSFSYKFIAKRITVTPFLGANNLLNTKYYDNIRINAFGNRFYEPAPEFNLYGGIFVRF